MEDQREQINPDNLTFVDMDDDAEHPIRTGSFTGFKPGQKILHLTESGGQPDMRIVTIEREAMLGGGIGLVVFVKEHSGYLDTQSLYSFEHIKSMFDYYTEEDARRWRAIDDGIIPAAQLSNEEIDKIIDDNEEWCKTYEDREREYSRQNAENKLLDQIPEDQIHTDDEDDEVDDLGGPSHVMGSSPTCQP